jgi:hypothetical protein
MIRSCPWTCCTSRSLTIAGHFAIGARSSRGTQIRASTRKSWQSSKFACTYICPTHPDQENIGRQSFQDGCVPVDRRTITRLTSKAKSIRVTL